MRRTRLPSAALLLSLALAPAALALTAANAHAEARYETAGRIVSISNDRRVVHIAHERIPGVMGAMTMSFTARPGASLAGFAVGTRVRFAFTVTDDGQRLLDRLEALP